METLSIKVDKATRDAVESLRVTGGRIVSASKVGRSLIEEALSYRRDFELYGKDAMGKYASREQWAVALIKRDALRAAARAASAPVAPLVADDEPVSSRGGELTEAQIAQIHADTQREMAEFARQEAEQAKVVKLPIPPFGRAMTGQVTK